MLNRIDNPYTLYDDDQYDGSKIVRISKRVENNAWFFFFGTIQQTLLSLEKSHITINLSECTYFSPEPFLSLCLTLFSSKIDNKNIIRIILPKLEARESARFLRYCYYEGFYSLLCTIDENIDPIKVEYANAQSVSRSQNYHPIIPAKIINIHNQVVSDVTKLLVESIVSYGISLDQQEKKDLNITIRNILYELIDNVKKHAYTNGKSKFFAVYVRTRFETDITRNQNINEYKIDSRSSFLPSDIFLEDAIEIYFMDLGKGLIESWKEKELIKRDAKRPLREIVEKVFFMRAVRKQTNVTAQSGLDVIKALLYMNNSPFRIVSEDESTGGFVKNILYVDPHAFLLDDYEGGHKKYSSHIGLIYSFSLLVNRQKQSDLFNESIGLSSYAKRLTTSQNRKYKVIDSRRYAPGINKFNIFDSLSSDVYYFIDSNNYKHIIIKKLNQVLLKNEQIENLLVCDVDIAELHLFEYALRDTSIKIFDTKGKCLLKQIIIISNTFHVLKFVVDNNTKRFTIDRQYSFSKLDRDFNYIYQLKLYETSVLLSLLGELNIDDYILTKGCIQWGDTILSGFINFDVLQSNSLLYEFIKINLIRVFSLINCSELYPIEYMVQRLTEEINEMSSCLKENGFVYYLGSVYMSGSTLLSTNADLDKCIHFFDRSKKNHEQGTAVSLFFSPDKMLINENNADNNAPEYERVGKTQKIRKISDPKRVITTNCYLNPIETFELLHQYTYSPASCGHYAYEGRHSLLAFDFVTMLKDPSSGLSTYLNDLINSSLEHYENKQEFINHVYWSSLSNTCMIVFLSHYLTEETLQKCEYNYNKYSKYILGLTHRNVLRHEESLEFSEMFSIYISKMITEYKENRIKRGEKIEEIKVKMVIFDSIISSGRTRKEIKQYLRNLGCDTVIFASIIDAQCYRYDKPDTYRCYIDLSFPTLGKSNSCAVCDALNKLKNLTSEIICYQLMSIIDTITKKWDVKGIQSLNNTITLKSFPEISTYSFDIDSGNYMYENVKFTKAIPLYLYISHRIKLENDFYIFEKFLDSVTNIDEQSLLYLCSMFIIEFKEACYFRLICKVYYKILDCLEITNDNSVSELALISLLSIKNDVQEKLFIDYLNNHSGEFPRYIYKQLFYASNYSIIVKLSNNDFIKTSISVKVKIGNNQLDAYRQFHYQLINTRGELHNPPLKRILTNFNEETKSLVFSSLYLLKWSLSDGLLDFYYLFENNKVKVMVENRERLLIDINDMLYKSIFLDSYNSIQSKVKSIYKCAMELHDAFFARANLRGDQGGRTITDALDNVLDLYNQIERDRCYKSTSDEHPKRVYFFRGHSIARFDSTKMSDAYYIWNAVLEREVLYSLTNISKHASDNFFLYGNEEYYGVVEIFLEEKEAIIEISNLSLNSADEINNKLNERYGISAIRNLGIQLHYEAATNIKFFNQTGVKAVFRIPNIEYANVKGVQK